MKQPLYTLQVNVSAAAFEVTVNDIPLYDDLEGNPTKVELPINHLLTNGNNKIKVNIYPSPSYHNYQEHTKVDFLLYIREITDLRTNRQMLNEVSFNDHLTSDEKKQASLTSTLDFQVSSDFYPAWLKCSRFNLNQNLLQEAKTIYEKYLSALTKKDLSAIFKLTALKDADFVQSYYSTIQQHQAKLEKSYNSLFNDPGFELMLFDKQIFTPSLHCFGKLLTFNNQDNRSPLQYYHSEDGFTQSFPIYLGLLNSKLSIVA